jgi:hypothetical protein
MSEFSIKSLGAKIVVGTTTGVIVALLVGFILNKVSASTPDNKDIKSGVIATLKIYEQDINKNKFDAEKYFARDVQYYFQMPATNPSRINKYWIEEVSKVFRDTKIRYDESTINIISATENEYFISIVMYSDYYNLKREKQVYNERSRFELKFNKDFKMTFMRQHFN